MKSFAEFTHLPIKKKNNTFDDPQFYGQSHGLKLHKNVIDGRKHLPKSFIADPKEAMISLLGNATYTPGYVWCIQERAKCGFLNTWVLTGLLPPDICTCTHC